MLYRRLHALEPSRRSLAFNAFSSLRISATGEAINLRARAAHYRELAETFYDQRIISELESFASELESEAASLDVVGYPYRAFAR